METKSHPTLIVCSRAEADALSQREDMPFVGVIALIGREERPCYGFGRIEHRMHLDFDDMSPPPPTSGRPMEKRAPREMHMQRVIEFAELTAQLNGMVLIHCTAGRSRSPAAAMTLLASWKGSGRELDAAEELFRIRPRACPNKSMIRLADHLLNREGRLLAALDQAMPNWDLGDIGLGRN